MPAPNTLGERFIFSVAVTKEQAAELRRLAVALGMKRASLVRRYIQEGIERSRRLAAIASALDRDEAAS